MRLAIIPQAVLLASVFNIGPAIAAPAESTRIVHTFDLDLTRHHDRGILNSRIAAAIAEVCGPEPRIEEGDKNNVIVCRATAFQSARRQTAQLTSKARSRQAIALAFGR